MARYYYKCKFCLGVFAYDFSEGQVVPGHDMITCGICRTKLNYMGKVSEDQTALETERTLCKCDKRCTDAQGPICNCECKSANHGKGVAGYTVITVEENIPIATFSRKDLVEKHTRIRDEMLEKETEIREMINGLKGQSEGYFKRRYAERLRDIMNLLSMQTRQRKFEALKVDIATIAKKI